MEASMTLEELLPAVHQLPPQDKVKLIRILAEDLDVKADISPFEPGRIYYLPTPYNAFGAGKILMDAMAKRDKPEE
jgi:hypothetical protein